MTANRLGPESVVRFVPESEKLSYQLRPFGKKSSIELMARRDSQSIELRLVAALGPIPLLLKRTELIISSEWSFQANVWKLKHFFQKVGEGASVNWEQTATVAAPEGAIDPLMATYIPRVVRESSKPVEVQIFSGRSCHPYLISSEESREKDALKLLRFERRDGKSASYLDRVQAWTDSRTGIVKAIKVKGLPVELGVFLV